MPRKSKTTPVVEATETPCEKSGCCAMEQSSCKCGDDCKCGDNCKCKSHKSCCKTFAKCFTTLLGSLMISASILIVGMECSKPQPAYKATTNIDAQIASYLNKNAELVAQLVEKQKVLIEEKKKIEEAKARQRAEEERAKKVAKHKDKIISDKSNYSLGNKNGKYVIIEFFDYRCGWCKKTNKAIWEKIESKKAPNIRWIPIDSPIFGEASALISRYVLAAGKQGKYNEMHHAVVKSDANLDKTKLIEIAKPLGLNIDQLTKDAESEELKKKIEANIKLAEELGVTGVPFMIVNGKPHGGALLDQYLEKAVKESNEMK